MDGTNLTISQIHCEDNSTAHYKVGNMVFPCLEAMVEEDMWLIKLKELRKDMFHFGQALINFLKFHS